MIRLRAHKPSTMAPAGQQLRYWAWWMPLFVVAWLAVFIVAFPDPLAVLQRNWPFALVGFLGAILGNATAVGGGVVFIPVVMFIYHLPAITALKLALAGQSFGMTSGAIGWAKRGAVPLAALKLTVPALLLGATISSLLIHPSSLLVKGLFGPVSILIGVTILFLLNRHGQRDDIPAGAALPLATLSFVGGILAGWVAVGVGSLVAVYLMLAYGVRAERSIGLGVILMAIGSLYLVGLHSLLLGGIPWEMALLLGFGCVFGGRLGPYLSQWIGPRRLKSIFAAIAIADGTIFVLQFILVSIRP